MPESSTAIYSALRQELKLDKRTRDDMLAAAVNLALDQKLLPTKVCADRKLPAGSHSRAKALSDRIIRSGLLGLCTPDPQEAPALPLVNAGLSESLLVQLRWIADHASNLRDVTAGPLVLSSDGQTASRIIYARLDGQEEQLSASVEYDLPRAASSDHKLFTDRHRCRDISAILSLDKNAAVEHRAKKARLQQGLREQRTDVDEDKILRGVVERLVVQLQREADIERRRMDRVQRLSVSGSPDDRACLHIGDLIYITPESPPPYVRFVRLAVLRRIHQSGQKVDVELHEVIPLEMGVSVDRLRPTTWIHGLSTASILGPVAPSLVANPDQLGSGPYAPDAYRSGYPREFWPTAQLWNAAKFAEKHSNTARFRLDCDLDKTNGKCRCHFWGCAWFAPPGKPCTDSHRHRFPLLSELAEASLPTFLEWNSKLWQRAIASFSEGELERAAEREYEMREF